MLASYASTATQAYNQQVGVCVGVRVRVCVLKLPSVCYRRQAVHFLLRTPSRVYLCTTLLLLVEIRLARTS